MYLKIVELTDAADERERCDVFLNISGNDCRFTKDLITPEDRCILKIFYFFWKFFQTPTESVGLLRFTFETKKYIQIQIIKQLLTLKCW